MSDEIRRNETELENAEKNQENVEKTQNIQETADTEKPKTTYSWVNPKIKKETEQAEQNDDSASQYPYHTMGETTYKSVDKKVKKERSLIQKLGMCAAYAAVFGVVAGGVMYGVNYAGNSMFGNGSSKQADLPTTQIEKSTDENNNNTSGTTATLTGTGTTVADIAESAMPSLVAITATSVQEVQSFFGTQEIPQTGSGTGVIVGKNDTELLIATNNHVVEGARTLSVSFIDQQTIEGQIKGTDPENDLAVVSVKLSDIPDETYAKLKIAVMGNSDDLRQGEQVVAIGNALGYGQSVTSGYVSALDRSVSTDNGSTMEGMIQTDAAINPGNSGGALLNMKGELIGINEAKLASTEVEGIGYAIPISKAEPILENLMTLTTRDKVDEDKASYLGVTIVNVSSSVTDMYNIPAGACISELVEDGPAEKAGMKKGDIITKFDGRNITSADSLLSTLQYYAAGETVDVVVKRAENGEYKEETLQLTLGSKADMPQTMQQNQVPAE